jgi:hypothetical protein
MRTVTIWSELRRVATEAQCRLSMVKDRLVALTPWGAARTIAQVKQQRDEARLMLTMLAAEIVQSKRRPSKPVEKLLEQYLPVAREW